MGVGVCAGIPDVTAAAARCSLTRGGRQDLAFGHVEHGLGLEVDVR